MSDSFNGGHDKRKNRRRRIIAQSPFAWSVPRPGESWLDLHYNDVTIPQDTFRQQLRP